jgi:carbamoyl-phosphate synthase large subunit
VKKINTILVTGCGGDIGTAVGRLLKELKVATKIVGTDICADNAGLFVFDVCDVLPRSDAPEYFDKLKRILKKYSPDLVIPMSDAEIRVLHRSGVSDLIEGVPTIMANSKALEIGIDKLKTAEFLNAQGLPYPWTLLVKDGPPHKLPCVIKNRGINGKGGVMIIDDQIDIDYFGAKYPDHIWQEALVGDEYTAGVYGCADGSVRTIIMKRKLSDLGFTVAGETVADRKIERVLVTLARALDLRGSINVQLRTTKKGPCIFEINPRLSSTVAFRHWLGFTDLLWALQERLSAGISSYKPPKNGTKFYKGYTEYISK